MSLASPGANGLPLGTLISKGLITDAPDASLAIPGTPVEAAALGYLHANCGTTCHNDGNGYAAPTGFFMRLNVGELGSVGATDTYTTGVGHATTNFHQVTERIAKCDTANSCVFVRMSQRDGIGGVASGTQMPPIDTHMVDVDGGLPIVAAWINEGCPPDDAGAHPDSDGAPSH